MSELGNTGAAKTGIAEGKAVETQNTPRSAPRMAVAQRSKHRSLPPRSLASFAPLVPAQRAKTEFIPAKYAKPEFIPAKYAKPEFIPAKYAKPDGVSNSSLFVQRLKFEVRSSMFASSSPIFDFQTFRPLTFRRLLLPLPLLKSET